jgi:hypothetical protein
MKTKRLWQVAAACAAVFMPMQVVFPQTAEYAAKGVLELGGTVSFSSIADVSNGKTGDATTLFTFAPRIAGFVTDGFQIGFSPGISFLPTSGVTVMSPPRGESTTLLQLFAFPAYVVRTAGQKYYPFIEVPVGYTRISSGNDAQSGFSWGLRGGIKVTPVGNFLLTVFGEYYQITLNRDGAKEHSGFNLFTFGIGVGAFL